MEYFWVSSPALNGRANVCGNYYANNAVEAIFNAFGVRVVGCGKGAVSGEYVTQCPSVAGFQYWRVSP